LIKAIDTYHSGYKFRSRLEAKWAVFFEAMDIDYVYEKEGFVLDGDCYLPDFWIPEWNCWIEIKPEIYTTWPSAMSKLKKYKDPGREVMLCRKLCDNTNQVVLLIGGSPWVKSICPDGKSFYDYKYEYGIIIFYPQSFLNHKNFEKSLQTISFNLEKAPTQFGVLDFDSYTSEEFGSLYSFIKNEYKEHPEKFDKPMPKKGDVLGLIEADKKHWFNKNGTEHPKWIFNLAQGGFAFQYRKKKLRLYEPHHETHIAKKLLEAYSNAQQKRFEKGN
jgi:hypothetical protein